MHEACMCDITWHPTITHAAQQIWATRFDAHHIRHQPGAPLMVCCHCDHLTLSLRHRPDLTPLVHHFDDAHHRYRIKTLHQSKHPLAKACGMVRGMPPLRILDMTAGWGEDSFVLAHLGAHVHALEQHPLVALMLAQNIERHCKRHTHLVWQSTWADHAHHLKHHPQSWDVIYFDMMFPPQKGHAKTNKKMQILQALLDHPPIDANTWELASQRAKRIVVKQPANNKRQHCGIDNHLTKPTFMVQSKNACFQIWTNAH